MRVLNVTVTGVCSEPVVQMVLPRPKDKTGYAPPEPAISQPAPAKVDFCFSSAVVFPTAALLPSGTVIDAVDAEPTVLNWPVVLLSKKLSVNWTVEPLEMLNVPTNPPAKVS